MNIIENLNNTSTLLGNTSIGTKITGIGMYLPPKIETSADLAPKIKKNKKWIDFRTGVLERRISDIDVDEMGAIAGRNAIGNGAPPDLIINASGVGKQAIPDTSVYMQRELGYEGIPSFSVHATCLSFLVALKTADSFIKSGSHQRILIVSSDRGSRGRNFDQPESAALFGDGAAAIVVEPAQPDENSCVINWSMKTWPSGADLTQIRGGGTNLPVHDPRMKPTDYLFSMDGPQVYKIARKKVYDMIVEILEKYNLKQADIDLVVPHQASGFGVRAYVKYGGFRDDQVVNIIGKTGNCVAASMPMAFAFAHQEGRISRGDLILIIGTGAGLSVASALIRY